MTRVKEQPFDSNKLPDYKSAPARIVRSLRKGYDNQRGRLDIKSDRIIALTGKLRDTVESREEWKARAKSAEAKSIALEQEIQELRMNQKKALKL